MTSHCMPQITDSQRHARVGPNVADAHDRSASTEESVLLAPSAPQLLTIPMSSIRVDERAVRARARLDSQLFKVYANAYRRRVEMPPIVVHGDGACWLARRLAVPFVVDLRPVDGGAR